MRLAVVGSRYEQREARAYRLAVYEYLDDQLFDGLVIVSGGCPDSPDELAENWADTYGVKKDIYPVDDEAIAKYGSFGKAAFGRNQDIVAACDRLVAFWNGVSKGTKNSIDIALKAHKNVEVFFPRLDRYRPGGMEDERVGYRTSFAAHPRTSATLLEREGQHPRRGVDELRPRAGGNSVLPDRGGGAAAVPGRISTRRFMLQSEGVASCLTANHGGGMEDERRGRMKWDWGNFIAFNMGYFAHAFWGWYDRRQTGRDGR